MKKQLNQIIKDIKIKVKDTQIEYTYNEYIFYTAGIIVCISILVYIGVL